MANLKLRGQLYELRGVFEGGSFIEISFIRLMEVLIYRSDYDIVGGFRATHPRSKLV